MGIDFKYTISSIVLILFLPFVGEAQTNISVVKDDANVYSRPNTDAAYHFEVQVGDVFEVYKTQADWIQINLFSGNQWFIKASQVEMVNSIPAYPSNPEIRDKVCMETKKARDKANQKAMADYPDDLSQQTMYEKILFDKFLLETFRNFDIPASHYSKLVECVNDGIFPLFKIEN